MSSSREKILERVAYAREINPQIATHSQYIDIMKGEDDLLSLYKRNQIANKAVVIESTTKELKAQVEEIVTRNAVSRLLYSSSLPFKIGKISKVEMVSYNRAREDMGDAIFGSDCALLEANLGIANLGILNVCTSPSAPRLLSLTTDKVIFLLKKDRIVRNIPEAIARMKKEYNELPTNILFIAGPSRTADIEFQVVFGVHGPREVFVILY